MIKKTQVNDSADSYTIDNTKEIEELTYSYYEWSFNHIKKLLDIIGVNDTTKIVVYSELEDYKPFLINNEIEKLSEELFKGSCTYYNLLKIIKYTTCGNDYPDLACSNFPTLKDGEYKDLYYFPELKLYLYIYDQRGGIIVSEDYDLEKMKIIFEKCLRCDLESEEDYLRDKDSLITLFKKEEISCLLNYYWIDKSIEIIYNS